MKEITIEEKEVVRSYVEMWSVHQINTTWCMPDMIIDNDPELIDMAIRDIGATVQINLFVFFPNYARLIVIKALDWCDQLSLANVAYVVKRLMEKEDGYVFDKEDYLMVLREVRKLNKN